MSDESVQKKTVFAVFPAIAYALVAAGVLDLISQISQGFAGQGNGVTVEFAKQLKSAAFRIASPFAILLSVLALIVFAALFYLRPREEAKQGWFLAVAAAGVMSLVVAGAALYDIVALLAGDDDFKLSDNTLRFSYVADWLSALALALSGLFIAVRLWTAIGDTTDESDEDEESSETTDEIATEAGTAQS